VRRSEASREQAILALLSEKTTAAAAKRCGVNERTLRRWLADEQFRAEFDAARQSSFMAGMTRIQSLTGKAVDALEELLAAKKHPAVRLGAARTVAEIAMHQHDAETILRKLEQLESSYFERRGRTR